MSSRAGSCPGLVRVLSGLGRRARVQALLSFVEPIILVGNSAGGERFVDKRGVDPD